MNSAKRFPAARLLFLVAWLATICACSSNQIGERLVPKPAHIASVRLEDGEPAFAIYHLKSLEGELDADTTPTAEPQPLAAGGYAATFRCLRIKPSMGGPPPMANAGRRQVFLFFVEPGASYTINCDSGHLGAVKFTLNGGQNAGEGKTPFRVVAELSEINRDLMDRAIWYEINKIVDDSPLPRPGTNRVMIQADTSGRIYGGYLWRSSGYPWLDAETVAALARIHRFPFRRQKRENVSPFLLDCPVTFPLERRSAQ